MPRFALTIFLGAFLLFQVQPILGRFILPWFGGGAGVWTVCMLFFQVALLAGYAYAHLLIRKVPAHRQVLVHTGLILLSLLFIPITPAAQAWRSTGDADQATVRILLVLTLHIGIPYMLLASTGPLLQSWFEKQFPGRSPYRLYSLSNVGSLLALMTYPFFFEPMLALRVQGLSWTICFVLYLLASGWCGWRFHQAVIKGEIQPASSSNIRPTHTAAEAAVVAPDRDESHRFQTFLWLALPAVGSIMLIATTNHLCQDLAVIPMLWVAPLAIYLITFIICFDADRWYHRAVFGPLLVLSVLLVNLVLHDQKTMPMLTQIAAFAFALFATCMVCHGELVRLRPPAQRLTAFYLCIAAGGALGGVFVALVAPVIFPDYWEYHVGLLASIVLAIICIYRAMRSRLTIGRRRMTLALASLLVIGLSLSMVAQISERLLAHDVTRRSFYGVLRIHEIDDAINGKIRVLTHGQITHGRQFIDPARAHWPTTYYSEDSGIGLAIEYAATPRLSTAQRKPVRIGGIGLGVGTMAALAHEGDHLRFYEISPQVEEFARKYFTYLSQSPAKVDVVLGDARIMLERELASGQPQAYDVLAVDAFNSDSIPIHLITREAVELYLKHLKPDGLLAFHITNRYIDLLPVMRGLSSDLKLNLVVLPSLEDSERLGTGDALWVVLTRDDQFAQAPLVRLTIEPQIGDDLPTLHWSDEFASVWTVINPAGVGMISRWLRAPNKGRLLIDKADLITREDERKIHHIQRGLFLDARANYPIAVVTGRGQFLDPRGNRQAQFQQVATQIYNDMGLRHPKTDNGMLLFIALDERQFIIYLGQAWDEAANAKARTMVKEIILPGLQSGQSSAAIVAAVEALNQLARQELK